MSSNLVTRMSDAVEKALDASDIAFKVLTGPVGVPIDNNGSPIPSLSTRVRDYINAAIPAGDLDGVDGIGIESLNINSSGDLVIALEGQSPVNLGRIVPTDGVGISSLTITQAGVLQISLENGNVINAGTVTGEDGLGITDANIVGNDLILDMSDGSVINAGDISQFGGVTANGADITESGDLVILFSDGAVDNVGRVVGDKGDNGVSTIAGFIDANGVLRFYRSNGTQYNVGQAIIPILDNSGNTIDGARIENGDLILELSSGDFNAGRVLGQDGVDGTDGADGVSVINAFVDQNDNQLYIELTGSPATAVGEVRTTIFEGADVSVTDANIDVNGDLNLDVNVNGTTSTINVGNVVGTDGVDGTVFTEAKIVNGELVFVDTSLNELNAGLINQVTISSANIDSGTGELTFNLSDGSTILAGVITGQDGLDGTGINGAYISNGDLFFTFTDPGINDVNAGSILAPVETDAEILGNGNLVITLSDGQSFDVGRVRGVDGIHITSASIVNGELNIELSDSSTIIAGEVEQYVQSASITNDGRLRLDYNNGVFLETTERVQGFDGDTITGVTLNASNELVFSLSTDNGNTNAQVTVPMVKGRSITDISLDETTRVLTIQTNLSSTPVLTIDVPKGLDGDTITSIDLIGEDVVITYTDNDRQTTNNLVIPSVVGRSVTDVVLDNVANTITISTNMVNDPEFTFDIPAGIDGASVLDVRFENNDLVIETNIPGSELLNIEDVVGPSVTSVGLDVNNDVLIQTSDGQSVVLNTIEGFVGTGIQSISFDGNDLIIEVSETETVIIPAVRGVDGFSIHDVAINVDGDLEITVNEGESPLVFPSIKGVDAPVVVTNAFIDVNGDLVFERLNDTDLVIPAVQGRDGDTITSVSLVGDDLVIDTSLDAPDDQVVVPTVKGTDAVDGATIASGTINASDELVLTMDDAGPTVFTIPGVGASIVGASIDAGTGQLIINLSDSTTITTTESIVGRDGNGTGVTDVTFTNGELVVTLTDAALNDTIINAGNVSMVSVTNARIDELNQGDIGELVFEFSDGSEVNVGNVYGEDGRFVSSVDLDVNNHLILTMSNGDTIDAGFAKGPDGRTITNVEVLLSGDLIITYDDATTDNAGSIGTGAGLTIWDINDTPYVKDRVVIHDGGLYLSLEDNNSDEPPSPKWVALALGDQIIEVRPPTVISPFNGDTSFSVRPTLRATPYAAIVSIDGRDYREFQVTTDTDTGFASPVYTAQVNSDAHELTSDLTINSNYIWRCRDVSLRGFISGWSDVAAFNVPNGVVETPVVTIDADENANSAFAAPEFHTTVFDNQFNAELHAESDWQVQRVSDEVVVYESLQDTVNLESIVIPYGNLVENTQYRIRAKHRGTTIESAWSDWFTFTTESEFLYIEKPVVAYDGDILSVSIASPTFNSSIFKKEDGFLAESANIPMSHVSSDWEVVNADTGTPVEDSLGDTMNLVDYSVQTLLENNVNYRIRVRYNSDRFGVSEWSDYLNFSAEQYIDQPTVSTVEDVNNFPSSGFFNGTAFSGVNETHVSTDWEFRDFNTDEIILDWTSYEDTDNLVALEILVAGHLTDRDFKVRIRYNGLTVSSPWAAYLDFRTGLASETLLYSGSQDQTVRKIDPDGNQVWSFTGHTSTVFTVAVDSNGNVYSGSVDQTVRKIDPNGNQIWSFTGHAGQVNSVSVDANGNVYSGARDNTVRKIDSLGNQIWSFTGHDGWVYDVAVDSNSNVYSGSADQTVRKIDSLGNQVWSFTGHTSTVYDVTVDANGNVYSGSQDITVRKIDPNGNQIWSFTGHSGSVFTVAVDSNGNVYSGSQDTTARKIDSLGNQVWSFTGHAGQVRSVAVDANGNVYSGSSDQTVRKIDPDGNQVWSFTGHTSTVYDVAVDPGAFTISQGL